MDPALQEYISLEAQNSELEAIVKLLDADVVPLGVKIVSRFGDIATCRLPVADIPEVWANEAVISLKAPRYVSSEPQTADDDITPDSEALRTRAQEQGYTGHGVVVGIVDWGFDFTHPNFIDPHTGDTRFLAIWDQTAPLHSSAQKYGYGRIYSQAEINVALRTQHPFDALGYQPGRSDIDGQGTHGTHVTDIAAGNGTVGEVGVAPQAHLVGVHLSAGNVEGLANLGDSVRILEAIDFMGEMAAEKPLSINLSVGKHGGSHQGNSLVEQGFDNFVRTRPGRAIINSAGNYYSSDTHASGRVLPGGKTVLRWEVDENDRTPNELEVWYSGKDVLRCTFRCLSDDTQTYTVDLGEKENITYKGKVAGRIYHRTKEPNTGNHHINIFLYRQAPKGQWELTLEGVDVVDGRYHAWIERDSGCSGCQSRFHPDDVDRNYTTGSICNGFYTLAVGAYDPYTADWPTASFSSAGPTADGRQKPNLLAPGVHIRAARSAGSKDIRSTGLLTNKSGTSMAAPHVTGAVALLFEAAEQPLTIDQTRNALLTSLQPPPGGITAGDYQRGIGILDIEALLSPYAEKRVEIHYPKSETIPNMETTFLQAEQITTHADLRLVLSRNAILRQGPPSFANIGSKLDRYTVVQVMRSQSSSGNTYIEVALPLPAGAAGPPQVLGWTLASNLESNDATTINWATVKNELVRIANREYDAWNMPIVTFETNPQNFPEQKAYWGTVGVRPTDGQLGSRNWQSGHAWSAAFISYVVQQAGTGMHFCYNAYHSCYIVCARHNRQYGHRQNPFWAYPINDPIAAWPEPGDIVCKNRSGGALTLVSTLCGDSSHCDIVVTVDRERRQIITVGGNVDNRVARRIVKLTPLGFIDAAELWEIENAGSRQPNRSQRSQGQYFAIIKVRTNLAAIPTATGGVTAVTEEDDFMGVEAVEIDDFAGGWTEENEFAAENDYQNAESYEDVEDDHDDDYDRQAEYENDTYDDDYAVDGLNEQEEDVECGCSHRESETLDYETAETHYGQHASCQACGEHWLKQAREDFANPLHLLNPRSQEAAQLFDSIAYDKVADTTGRWLEQYNILSSPRTIIGDTLLPGDVLLERNFGSGHSEMAVLISGELLNYKDMQREGLNGFSARSGYYAEVLQGEQQYTRRIADEQGRLLANQVVLRARPASEQGEMESGSWIKYSPTEITTLKNEVVTSWGSASEVVDPVFFAVYPEWMGQNFGSLSAPDKARFKRNWRTIANELITERRERVLRSGLIPSLGGDTVSFGFKHAKYGSLAGLIPDPDYGLYNTGRLDTILGDLHRRGKISITQDELDIFQRIANVETSGKIHTLNTYDSALVTIGFMQFTLHVGKIQEWIKLNETAFRRYGIELSSDEKYTFRSEDRSWTEQAIKGVPNSRKEELRWNGWAERFYYAGLDEDIIIAQVTLAKQYLTGHLNGLKSRLKKHHGDSNNTKYNLFKTTYYERDAYVRGLFQESYNNNPQNSTICVSNALDNLDDGNVSISHFLEKYKEQLVPKYHRKKKNEDKTLAKNPDGTQIYERGLVEKTAIGTNVVLTTATSEGEDYWMESEAPCNSYTCWTQESLNILMGTSLTVNGRISQDMRTLIRQFQNRLGITETGTIDPTTERALLEARARHASSANAVALRLDTTESVLREASRRILDYTAQVPLTACMDRVEEEDRKRYYNYRQRRADQRDPRLIKALVLHQMAFLRTQQTAEAHKCTNSHFIILQDGSIYQLHPISAHLYASHGWNPRSVAVEFAGHFRNVRGGGPHIPTQAQYEAGRFLVKYLIHLLGVDKVLTHSQSSTKSGDPGPDIWQHVGEWSMQSLGITDTTQARIGEGSIIPKSWRIWGKQSGSTAAEAREPQPLQTQCGFFGARATAMPKNTLVQQLQTIVTNARSEWLSTQNRLLPENQPSQFPFLLVYRLSVFSSIPTHLFQGISANALTANYSALLALPVGNTTARRQEVARTRGTLLNRLILTNAPANLNALVESAIVNALDSHHDDDINGAWSAAFISSCVRSAAIGHGIESSQNGIYSGQNELLVASNRHSEFLEAAYLRRLGNSSQRRSATYHAFRADITTIEVGDIIVQDRHTNNINGVTPFSDIPGIAQRGRNLHSDIVVEVNSGYIVAIGGNLGQSVRRRRFPIGANGSLIINRQTLYSQESDSGVLPIPQANPNQGLHTMSTGRIFAVLKLAEACILAPPGQPIRGGVIV